MGVCRFCKNSIDTGPNAVLVSEGHDCEVCGKTWAEIRAERDDSAALDQFAEGEEVRSRGDR